MLANSTGPCAEYIRSHLKRESDPQLRRMIEYAAENFIPILLPESAAFLRQLVMLIKPEKTLEIGTAIGFSGQLILTSGGQKLYTVEINEELAETARKNFAEAGLEKRATVFTGDAGEILPLMDGSFDMIFMDGPKTKYIEYLPQLMRMLKSGGALLCDNVLFSGMITGEAEYKKSKSTIVQGLDRFLEAVCSDDRLVTSILPVGDGMSLSLRR
ncbi:MAG: O-methyltransferase [Christensenellales bacterium]